MTGVSGNEILLIKCRFMYIKRHLTSSDIRKEDKVEYDGGNTRI